MYLLDSILKESLRYKQLIQTAHIVVHTVGFLLCFVLIVVTSLTKSRFSQTTRPTEKRDYFCTDCQLEVQGSTKHCNQCGMCVDKFDHHCVWLNICIGNNNYKLFISTVFACMAVLTYTFAYTVALCLPANRNEVYIASRTMLAVVII